MSRPSLLFRLWAIQGLGALIWLAALAGDAEHSLLLGFSGARLLLLGIALTLTGISLMLWRFFAARELALRAWQQDALLLFAFAIVFLAPALILTLFFLGRTSGFVYTAYAGRLAPLAAWCAISALELAFWLTWPERGTLGARLAPAKGLLRPAGCAILALAALAVWVSLSGVGLTAYNDGSWGSPTTPLLEWQILLALILAGFFMVFGPRWSWLRKDRWLALLIYLSTCGLWLSQPVNPGFFATPPRAPNFEIYPFSDALIYAQYVQSALVGHGFLWPDVPTRPLYIAFLTWLHALAGQDYTHVIMLQTLVLAAFPVVLYFLGKELGGRPLGIGLALLAALRDLTANIAAPFALNYTYSKLFFSEMPTALLISLFTLLALRWMRNPRGPAWQALLIGGVLGLATLIRLQSAVILAAVIPIGFFVIKDRRRWALGSALSVLGVCLALVPWLARNYLATGGLVFDNPTSQAMVLARRWSGDSDTDLITYLPGENAAQYSSRMTGLALASLQREPGRILGSAANHFVNNEIGNLLIYPLRDRLDGPAELLWPAHAFWQTWSGRPEPWQLPVIALYLLLPGIGLAVAWYRNGLLGLLPFSISLAYNAWTALFLSSGDRFLVPVDWGVYLYHFLGLLTLAAFMLSALKSAREDVAAWINTHHGGDPAPERTPPFSWRATLSGAALILALGNTLPLTESLFPRIPPQTMREAIQPPAGQTVLYGRAVYPRYYAAGEGEPGTAKLGYGKSDQARLVFYLVGDQSTLVIFPRPTAPAFFPNASDVAVVGVQAQGFFQAEKIIVQKDDRSAEYVP